MAGRLPQPWYRRSKQAWYVHLHGKTHRLGKDKEEAFRAFHRLMAEQGEAVTPDTLVTVGQLVERYLSDLGRRAGGRTIVVARCYLKPFLAACGRLQAKHLRKHHVEEVVRRHGQWNATTENHVKSRILAVFNWAVEQALLNRNPVKGLKKPKAKSRGVRTLISPADHARLMEAAAPYLREVLLALHQTGARPGEVLSVTAAEFFPEQGVWVLDKHKTEHETGRPRIVHLTPELVALCRKLAERYPEGPLFRRARGKPFPQGYYLARLVRRLRERLGIPGVIPYGYRHTFATDALEKGVPEAQVAELLGHDGTAMLHKHYAHLSGKTKALQDALSRVRPASGS
jgi:integrase